MYAPTWKTYYTRMKFLKIVFFLICVFAAFGAHAQSSAELKRRRDKLNEELQQLNQEYQRNRQQ